MALHQATRLWPTEIQDNPAVMHAPLLEPRVDDIESHLQTLVLNLRDEVHEKVDEDSLLASAVFRNPRLFRQLALDTVRVPGKENYDGKSFVCVWPTKFCPVGCDCCFFSSPAKDAPYGKENTITDGDGSDRLIQFLEDANVGELVVAGGGEPFLRKEFMYKIAREAKADKIFFTTSGYWAKSPEKARELLAKMYEEFSKNPHGSNVDFRVSLDKFHAAKLSPDGSLEYVMNLIQIFRESYSDKREKGFTLGFHSMEGDETMEDVLKKLPVVKRERKNIKTEVITLSDGFSFEIRWKRLFYSDASMSMNDTEAVERNTEIFDHDISSEHGGNMSVVFNPGDQPKGLDWLIHYDGTALSWGAGVIDNEQSIYTHSYAELVKSAKNDPVSLRFLERGNDDRNAIIGEVNPRAVARSKAINLRDFYSRIILEEDQTKLYLTIRTLQLYLSEGRIGEEDIKQWPQVIQDLVKMPIEKLQEGYIRGGYNIVRQYLDNPNVSIDDLVHLYRLVCRGHYDVTPEQMLAIIEDSQFFMREDFRARIIDVHNEYPQVAERFAKSVRASSLGILRHVDDSSLLSSAETLVLNFDELRSNKHALLAVLHPRLRPRFEAAFEFLLTADLDNLGPCEYEVIGRDVYAEEVKTKPGKGHDGATSEIHIENTDIQVVLSDQFEEIGLNTKGSATLSGAIDHPKREGKQLTSRPDLWRPISKGEIMIILPMTPHAARGIDTDKKLRKLTLKIRMD